ncbi:hypothetical protein HanXRQr2_Chr16g0769451 [Helianthus annuus]|uniref:Uncharacterized protein n=1 Tax=Helianthus annuus TaxID=4232 RepID=A0A9K3DUJ4_HELAN|nr:hypothetical protein HanXRQr2_Chr16g0769451 [Helianthus annuus]KAJ0822908.1 hypothetical protein HanPSC8_Chr16g0737521 [Helianthus annuus]
MNIPRLNGTRSGTIRVTNCQTTGSTGVISKSWGLYRLFCKTTETIRAFYSYLNVYSILCVFLVLVCL